MNQPPENTYLPYNSQLRSALHDSALIGHADIQQEIDNHLEALAQGRGGIAAWQAESGAGKSRLVWEAVDRARQQGIQSVYLPCRGGMQRPYDPVVELLRALLRIDPAQPVEAQMEQARQELARLMLGDLTGAVLRLLGARGTGPLYQEPDELSAASTLVFSEEDSLALVLQRLATAWTQHGGTRPLLLAFDDLDEAGAEIIAACCDLARFLGDLPVLLLVTTSPAASRDIQNVFGGVLRPLNDLPDAAARSLAAQSLGKAELTPAEIDLFKRLAGGRPLLIHLLAKHLTAYGSGDPPHNMRMVLARRIRGLPAGQRETLLPASVLGSGMRIGAMRAMRIGVNEDDLYQDLSGLVQAGWLEVSGVGRLRVYRFAHRLVSEMIYSSIPEELLKHLHNRAGDYYAVPATGRRLRVDMALHHYLRGRSYGRALAVVDMALADARREGDRAQIMDLYRRGAEIARFDRSLNARQAEMAERLGDLYAAAGDYSAAARVYRELAPTESPLSVHVKLALVLVGAEPVQAARVLPDLLRLVPPGEQGDLHYRLQAAFVWALALSDQTYEASRFCRDALGQLRGTAGLGDSRTLLRGMLGMVMFYQGDQDEAATHLESARAGWGARGNQDGVLLMNQVLIGLPREQITPLWLRFILIPLLNRN
jgi:tetratricopeptide (TPR) repeat protein